jgi:hypothetical protein
MKENTGTTSERLTTDQLLMVATEFDPATTSRRLEFWRNQHLLPHPERTGQAGTRPVWTYPPQAADQLRALFRLRKTTKDPDVLRVALWFEGYDVSTSRARDAMSGYVHKIRAGVERELARRMPTANTDDEASRWTVIEQIAQVLARKRVGSLPRYGRQPQRRRDRAVALTMGLALSEPRAEKLLNEESALDVEKLLGLTPGRALRVGDAEPWLSGPATTGLAGFAKFASLTELSAAVESADDTHLEAARANARTLLHGMSFVVRLADAFTGTPNATGITALIQLTQVPDICIWITALLASLARSPEHADGVTEVLAALSALQSVEGQVRELAAMSEEDRSALFKNLPNLPYRQQAGFRRVVEEFHPPA